MQDSECEEFKNYESVSVTVEKFFAIFTRNIVLHECHTNTHRKIILKNSIKYNNNNNIYYTISVQYFLFNCCYRCTSEEERKD